MTRQYAFNFDSSSCSGCKACQIACMDKHNLPAGVLWRRVYEISGGEWQTQGAGWVNDAFAYYLSISCNHCEKPICVEVCPTQALIKRPDGIVLIDEQRCIGCQYCSWACPYGALQYDEGRGCMTKCTLCADLLEIGEPPACVAACPMRALDFGEREELEARHGKVIDVFPLPDQALTEPALAITPHQAAIKLKEKGIEGKARIANGEEIVNLHSPSLISGSQKAHHTSWVKQNDQVDEISKKESFAFLASFAREKTRMKERSLVLFTLLMQTAAGAYLVPIGLQLRFGNRLSGLDTILLFRVAFWLVMGLSILGLLASFLHLGSARNAWYALSNLRSSWLSREIFFALLFTSSVSLFSVLGANTRPGLAMSALCVITGLSGLALVYCMSRIYRLRTVPRWNSEVTGLSFWTTTLLLGSLTSLVSFYLTALYVINYQSSLPMLVELKWRNNLVTMITPLTYLAMSLIIIQVFLTSKQQPQKSYLNKNIPGKHKTIASIRQWLLGLGGSGLLLYILFLNNPSPSIRTIASLVIVSWLCIVTSEALGKTLFYEARRQPGLVYPELPWSSPSKD